MASGPVYKIRTALYIGDCNSEPSRPSLGGSELSAGEGWIRGPINNSRKVPNWGVVGTIPVGGMIDENSSHTVIKFSAEGGRLSSGSHSIVRIVVSGADFVGASRWRHFVPANQAVGPRISGMMVVSLLHVRREPNKAVSTVLARLASD